MMKAYFMRAALLAMLAGVTLTSGAKPAEVQQWNNPVSAGRQDRDLMMALGPAGKKLGPRRDVPISVANPTQGA